MERQALPWRSWWSSMAKAGSHLTDTSLESGESLTEVFATCSGDEEGVGECRELGRALRA